MSLQSSNLFLKRLVEFINNPKILRALLDGELDEIAGVIGVTEEIITAGLRNHPDLHQYISRSTNLSRLLYMGFQKLDGPARKYRLINTRRHLGSILNYTRLLRGRSQLEIKDYIIEPLPKLDYYYWKNIASALLGKATPRIPARARLKFMMANNHILDLTLINPGIFVQPMVDAIRRTPTTLSGKIRLKFGLENQADNMPKIDDGMFVLDIPNLSFHTGERIVSVGSIKAFLTIDSKFLMEIRGIGSRKTVKQQMLQALGHRVEQSLLPVLKSMESQAISLQEQAKILDQLIPIVFQHQILKPRDTDDITQTLMNRYGDEFVSYAEYHFFPYFSAHGISDDVFDLVMNSMNKHADDHFRTGNFINKSSKLYYHDYQ